MTEQTDRGRDQETDRDRQRQRQRRREADSEGKRVILTDRHYNIDTFSRGSL